jgi:putative transposase
MSLRRPYPSVDRSEFTGFRFPPDVIAVAVRWYLRYGLSYRDVEELLAERGIVVSHETVRRWVVAFGPRYARRLRAVRCKPNSDWHLDEMFVSIAGRRMYLWRAVDAEGEVLDILVQARREQRLPRGSCENSCVNSG